MRCHACLVVGDLLVQPETADQIHCSKSGTEIGQLLIQTRQKRKTTNSFYVVSCAEINVCRVEQLCC